MLPVSRGREAFGAVPHQRGRAATISLGLAILALGLSAPALAGAVEPVPPELAGLRVVPAAVLLRGPESVQQLAVDGLIGQQAPRDVTRQATFESSNIRVATVDGSGLITARGDGAASITVKLGKLGSSTSVTVKDFAAGLPPAFFTIKWADILRNKREGRAEIQFATFNFHDWIRERLAANLPYDQFVRAILAASGSFETAPPVQWYRKLHGLLESTIIMVMGEFGRAPRLNSTGVPGADPLPGRDHWGNVMSVLVAGGGFARGRIVGASKSKGEVPRDRLVRPQELMITLYEQLGIYPETTFTNRAGRPIPIGSDGRSISELLG